MSMLVHSYEVMSESECPLLATLHLSPLAPSAPPAACHLAMCTAGHPKKHFIRRHFTFFSCYLGSFLSQGWHQIYHLILLLRLIQIHLLIVHNDLFKHTYNFTKECSMKICFVVANNLFRIQTKSYSTSQTSLSVRSVIG